MEKVDERKKTVQENPSRVDDAQTLQEQIVRGVLRTLVIVGPFVATAGSYYDYVNQNFFTIPLYWITYAAVLLIALWQKVSYTLRAWAVVVIFYGLAVLDFISDGRGGSGRVFLAIVPFVAALFLGRREGRLALVVTFLTMVAFGWAYVTGRLTVPDLDSAELTGWVSNTAVLLMLAVFVVVSLNYLIPRLVAALEQSRRLAQELEEERAGLETQVTERTADLARRSAQLETAAQVARDAAEIQDVERLLNETVRLISDRFGFYHAGIFLVDEGSEYADLRAASSEGGQRMLAQGHRLAVGRTGIVGYVTDTGEARIALDVGADAVFFDNPYLPETRSEMALPLRARGEIIGALDVQSKEPEAFSDEDVDILQTLADQTAVAIHNAQLFQQAQEALEAERRAYGELSRQAWVDLLREQHRLGYYCDAEGVTPLTESLTDHNEETPTELSIPVIVRDQVIGTVKAHKPDDREQWTEAEVALIKTLTEQLGVALESARLYQDTQRRAARERLTGEIATRIRETLDVDTVLRTAAREMRARLDLPEVVVRLAPEERRG